MCVGDAPAAFDYAKDLAEQLITLSTGILLLTITFANNFKVEGEPPRGGRWLKAAWVGYFLAIVCGIWTLMALTGSLNQGETELGTNARIPAGAQVIVFLASTVSAVVYAIRTLGGSRPREVSGLSHPKESET